MSLKVKSIEQAGRKFVERGSMATGDYKAGVTDTNDQAEKSIAAQSTYEQGIMQSIERGARVKGIEKAGPEKWKRKSLAVGAVRFAPGIKAGAGDYQKNVARYFDVLKNLTLSPRGPKGSPENYERVKEVGQALREAKLSE